MYGISSVSSRVSIPNEVRIDLWLSRTSNAEQIREILFMVPREGCKS